MPIEWLVADPARLLKTAVLGTVSYAALIVMLRVSGKRTLAQMNAFDFIVTVALGSTLSAILVSPEVSLAQGVLALGLLVGLQFVVTFATVRQGWMRRLVKNEPTILLYRGEMLHDVLRRERVAPAEVEQAIRSRGGLTVDEVHAVILETDGTFSVVEQPPEGEPTALGEMSPPAGTRVSYRSKEATMTENHDPGDAIGTVTHYFSHLSVAAVTLDQPLEVGDRIHVRGHTTDLVQTVDSMQVDHRDVEQAGPGDDLAIKVTDHVREHDKIYREPD